MYSNYSHEVSITDICWLRLDFESFTLLGTGNTVETDLTTGGGLCLDSFTVSVKKDACIKKLKYIYIPMLNIGYFRQTLVNLLWE